MVGLNYNALKWCIEGEAGDGFSIIECCMTESDKEYIKGLNLKPINYSFTWKKAVAYNRDGNIVSEWLIISTPDMPETTHYVRFVKE